MVILNVIGLSVLMLLTLCSVFQYVNCLLGACQYRSMVILNNVMLSFVMSNILMLNVIMLNVILLSVIKQNDIKQSVNIGGRS